MNLRTKPKLVERIKVETFQPAFMGHDSAQEFNERLLAHTAHQARS